MPSTFSVAKPMSVAERRRKVAALYSERKTQTFIADELGISQTTVSRDIKALMKQWRESSIALIEERVAEELGKINNLEREYWEAWHRSCGTQEISRTKIIASASKAGVLSGQQPVEKSIQKRDLIGNSAFLAGVQWCIDRRCKLLGLDQPEKREVLLKGYITFSPDDWDDHEVIDVNPNGHNPELPDDTSETEEL
jgi:hypothetical protein